MRVLLLISFVVSALGASTTPFINVTTNEPSTSTESSETEQPFCQEGECLSINECTENQGQIQESTVCTCPAVYCCYSSASTTTTERTSTVAPTERTTVSTSEPTTVAPTEPTTVSTPSTLSTSTEQQSVQPPETTVSAEGSSPASESSLPPVATEQQPPSSSEAPTPIEADCSSWTCVSTEECLGMDGFEAVNKEDCPEPYLKCCLPEY